MDRHANPKCAKLAPAEFSRPLNQGPLNQGTVVKTRTRTILLATAAGAALAATSPFAVALVAPHAESPAAPERFSDPFDPLALAGTACGRFDGRWLSRRVAFVAAAAAYAQETGEEVMDAGEGAPALLTGLGPSSMEITTSSAAAAIYFEQGLRLMHNFNHAAAIASFRQAQAIDPECAMCVWGEALSLGPNINAPMDPADSPRAYEAAHQAVALADAGGTDKERALAHALTYRYEAVAPEDRSKLDEAYADAMAEVADRFPLDDEIQAMAAEAIMDMQPWFYWEPGGVTPAGRADEALERLETVLARSPMHAPSIHLYIHMTEASADPWRAEVAADHLVGLAPAAGHLVHMPTHTYYRIGRFKDSLARNIEAVEADEAFLADTEGSVLYRYGYYPHNIHFALTSAQMAGDAETAIEMAGRLDGSLPLEMATTAPWVQPIKAAPWYAKAQFGEPASVLAEAGPGEDAPPFIVAAWRYARGEALAKLGRVDDALDEAAAIGVLRETADFSDISGGVPATETLHIMELVVRGRAATADGDLDGAVEAFEQAADIQAALPYTEPPFWWYPVRQSLAAALLRAGAVERAELEFYKTLVESPDNGWAYWGLAQARREMGDRRGARDAERKWRDAWAGPRDAISLERL